MGVWSVDPYKAMPQDVVDLPAITLCNTRFNWAVEDVRCRGVKLQTELRGEGPGAAEYVTGFEFVADPRQQIKTESMLCFGGFNVGAHYYAMTPRSLVQGAIKRLFGVRENESYHKELINNQKLYVATEGPVRFKEHFARNVLEGVNHAEAVETWVEAPHPKRDLRTQCLVSFF